MNANVSIPAASWVFSEGAVDGQGQPISIAATSVCGALLTPNEVVQTQYDRCIRDHGFQYKTVYQPANRYWLLQGIESGIYLLMTAILFALTLWWTKYRIIGTEKR